MRLPNLPVHYWNAQSLERIGNKLGRYIDKADPKGKYTCARVCVEIDLEAGLPEAIKLSIGTWHHFQKLDYEQLPFKCRLCHEHGHFQRNCPKAQQPEESEGWKTVKKSKTAPKVQEKRATNNRQKQDPNAAHKANSSAAKNTAEDLNKEADPQTARPSQDPAAEAIEMDNNQAPEAGDPLEPGEIPNRDSEKDPLPNLETEPPLSADPK